jgi:hypothetical protein
VLLLHFSFKNVLIKLLLAKNRHTHVRMLLNITAFVNKVDNFYVANKLRFNIFLFLI